MIFTRERRLLKYKLFCSIIKKATQLIISKKNPEDPGTKKRDWKRPLFYPENALNQSFGLRQLFPQYSNVYFIPLLQSHFKINCINRIFDSFDISGAYNRKYCNRMFQ